MIVEPTVPERLARVEAIVEAMQPILAQTAADARAVRDYMLTEKGRYAGSWKVLSLIGALLVGAATVGAAVAHILHA